MISVRPYADYAQNRGQVQGSTGKDGKNGQNHLKEIKSFAPDIPHFDPGHTASGHIGYFEILIFLLSWKRRPVDYLNLAEAVDNKAEGRKTWFFNSRAGYHPGSRIGFFLRVLHVFPGRLIRYAGFSGAKAQNSMAK
jgi:hypothetical protein